MVKQNSLNPIKAVVWLAAIIGVTIGFDFMFPMVISPAGQTGKLTNLMTFCSVGYVAVWICLSLLAGYKALKEILLAAFFYSLIPFIGVALGTQIPILGLLTLIWAVPIQGLCFETQGIFIFMFLQPVLFGTGFAIGYILHKGKLI